MQRRFFIAALAAIPVFWAVMMALLLKREAFVPRLSPSQSSDSLYAGVPTDTWMGILLRDGTQVGYVNVRTRPGNRNGEPGASVTILGRVRITMFESSSEMLASGTMWLSREKGLREFSFGIRSGDHDMSVTGAIEEGTLHASVTSAGETYPLDFPVRDSVRLSSGLGLGAANMPVLKPGDTFLMDTFDPLTLSMGQAKLTCVGLETIEIDGKRVEARVVTTTVSGVDTRAWVSDKGEVLRAETPMGFVIERQSEEDALHGLAEQQSDSGLTQLAAIRPTGQSPFRGARRMVVRFSGLDPGHALPTDATQTRAPDGTYIIDVDPDSPPDSEEPVPDDIRRAYLSGDPFIQTDSPRIRETARQIVDGVSGTWSRARLIYDWVYTNVEKTPVLSVPSALDVLDTMQGDCNENTVLYTALARAAGVPTRIAIGIVWSEAYQAFYYHAWPEVYVGRWYWVDPTLGQPLADATHIKLLNGSIETWWQLVPFLGHLKVRVESIQ